MESSSAFTRRGGGRRLYRGWRGGLRTLFKQSNRSKPDVDKYPLGELITIFKNSDLEKAVRNASGYTTIKHCKYLASYNWINTKDPVIVIPGKPARWTPLKQPQRLQEDDGEYFRDSNAARFPTYPTEPVVQAIFTINPDFLTSEIDVFACGSTMGSLFRFICQKDWPFRFSVELIGNTVFFVRKENDPKQLIEGIRGYGYAFPEANTTWDSDVKGSEMHQRIVQYQFAGLNFVVRFGCDGYLPDATRTQKEQGTASSTTTDHTITKTSSNVHDLLTAFDDMKPHSNRSPSSSDCALTINSGGSQVPQEAIFDLKTRSCRSAYGLNMEDHYPLLWLKQIPNFIAGYHDGRGLFEDVRVRDVRKEVQAWEQREENKEAIKRLAALLGKIVKIAKEEREKSGHAFLEVYCPSVDRLEIRKQHGPGDDDSSGEGESFQKSLPPSLTAKWAGGNKGKRGDELSGTGVDEDETNQLYRPDSHSDERNEGDDGDDDRDFTACSAEDCGYCGKCTY